MSPLTIIILSALLLLLIIYSVRNAEFPRKMAAKWAATFPLAALAVTSVKLFGFPGLFLTGLCAVVLSYLWTPHLGELLAKPLTSLFDGGNVPPEPRPLYSIATSKKKQGHYAEAIADIREQLDKFPNDFEGHMLLAEIQAENQKDLPGAQMTIEQLAAQSGHSPKNIAFALYSLADWHLRFGHSREAARQALQKVIDLLPNSEYSLGAAQRIAHLGSPEMSIYPDERKKFAVPEGIKNLGLLQARQQPVPPAADPAKAAADYVKHLEEHPLDMEAREKLAVIYAHHYKRLDLAAGELEQMIAEPKQPAKSVIHWLNLLADLQIQSGADYETVRYTLQRIIDRFPNLAAAEIARNRINILKLELRANEKTDVIKLGTYEQKLGLTGNR